jgi:hypothetical protein
MPKRKVAPTVPNYQWLGGELSIGEIILDMAKALLVSPNQLEAQRRTTEFVRRVNAAFAEQNHYVREQEKKGSHQKKQANPTLERVVFCKQELIKKGTEVTAPAIAIEWLNQGYGRCITSQQINTYLRRMKDT